MQSGEFGQTKNVRAGVGGLVFGRLRMYWPTSTRRNLRTPWQTPAKTPFSFSFLQLNFCGNLFWLAWAAYSANASVLINPSPALSRDFAEFWLGTAHEEVSRGTYLHQCSQGVHIDSPSIIIISAYDTVHPWTSFLSCR